MENGYNVKLNDNDFIRSNNLLNYFLSTFFSTTMCQTLLSAKHINREDAAPFLPALKSPSWIRQGKSWEIEKYEIWKEILISSSEF